jgi:hypothetical protein
LFLATVGKPVKINKQHLSREEEGHGQDTAKGRAGRERGGACKEAIGEALPLI